MVDVPKVGVFGQADGEEVVLGRHDAVQPVLQLGEHVDEVLLLGVGGRILLFEVANEDLESVHSLGSQGEHLAGEPVARGVERRALFAGFGARPGRFLGVQAIGAKAGFGGGRRMGSEDWACLAGRDGSLVGSLFIAAGGFFLLDMDNPLAVRISAGGKRTEGGSGGSH